MHFSQWFGKQILRCGFFGEGKGAKARRDVLQAIAKQAPLVVVGTHALFQDEVTFADLGLAVIDEQHRFGVGQRQALIQKGSKNGFVLHQLIMTATPIPRTMAMTAYADLDYSIIDALPKGRKPIQTVVLANSRRDDVVERVLANYQGGGQAYWVCTLIDESEVLQCQAAEATADMLAKRLPGVNVGLVHGKMPFDEKETVMQQFKNQQIALLVATTVIEVGVDVPNANLMIIENAERLGLAQLHQLRGRVGRGSAASYCVLLYQSPLSSRGQARLHLLRSTHDGFVIAEKDLQWRGSGEVLGTKQTGLPQYRIADVLRDQALLEGVQKVAKWLMQHAPERVTALQQRWVNVKQASYMHS